MMQGNHGLDSVSQEEVGWMKRRLLTRGGTAVAENQVPDDLMPFSEVLRDYRPLRNWWEQRLARGELVRYRVPGVRGIWLSRADVERLTAPRALEIRPKPKEEPTE